MVKKFKGPGKGSAPRNCFSKQYRDNYDLINWGHEWCAYCGTWGQHTSGSCKKLKKYTK